MSSRIRALVVDYDGTLASEGEPSKDALALLERARDRGLRLVLATGRILVELLHAFPDALERFDAIVAENGAVLAAERHERALAAPVDDAVDRALLARGIGFRRGFVLIAVSAGTPDREIFEAVGRCGLDCQIVRNRGERMILPPGVSKATGVATALAEIGISPHSAIAIGDAENDLAMLEACEVGVAVANAVVSLKERADVVLSAANGKGVSEIVEKLVHGDDEGLRSTRFEVVLGSRSDGSWVRMPASGTDLLIVGGSGSGKSFAAGLVAEQLIALGYVVCAIDPEGDHAPLARLARTTSLGGTITPPDPDDVARVLRQSMTSVVVDLSLVSAPERDAWTQRALATLEEQRETHGIPHWLLIDEAHAPLGRDVSVGRWFRPSHKGHCLVTYRPAEVASVALSDLDLLLLLPGRGGVDRESLEAVASVAGPIAEDVRSRSASLVFGEALLLRVASAPAVETLTLSNRWVRHVRHWHKYAAAQLPSAQRFYFRAASGALVGIAGNLVEFHRLLHRCDAETLSRHARAHDFSRWIAGVIADRELAGTFREIERLVAAAPSRAGLQDLRFRMLAAVEERYDETE